MIGGNTVCTLKTKILAANEIGENAAILTDYITLNGWLDLLSESTDRQSFNAKLAESTHLFICDYIKIDKGIRDLFFVDQDGKEYDILYIDNPMGLGQHLEIFLKYVGD